MEQKSPAYSFIYLIRLGTHSAWHTVGTQLIILMAHTYLSFSSILDQVVCLGYFILNNPLLLPFCS